MVSLYSTIKMMHGPINIRVIPYRPDVAQRLGRDIALLFHDRGTRRGWVVSSMSRPHFTPGKDPVPILHMNRMREIFFSLERSVFSVMFFFISQTQYKNSNFPRKLRFILPGNTTDLLYTNCQLSRVVWRHIILFLFNSASFCDDSVHNLWVITVIWKFMTS